MWWQNSAKMMANLAQNAEFLKIFVYWLFQRERKGERETDLWFHVLTHSLVAFVCGPGRRWNLWPLAYRNNARPTEQPSQGLKTQSFMKSMKVVLDNYWNSLEIDGSLTVAKKTDKIVDLMGPLKESFWRKKDSTPPMGLWNTCRHNLLYDRAAKARGRGGGSFGPRLWHVVPRQPPSPQTKSSFVP